MLISDGNFEAVVVGRKPNTSDEWWIVRWHDDKTLQRETLKGMGGWRRGKDWFGISAWSGMEWRGRDWFGIEVCPYFRSVLYERGWGTFCQSLLLRN